jgi:hypothetical protein
MVYETLTQITPRRCKQYLPSFPWREMAGRNARNLPTNSGEDPYLKVLWVVLESPFEGQQ